MTSKSNKHAEWVRFEITSIISDLNLKIRSSITTLSASILKSQSSIAQMQVFFFQHKYFIDPVLRLFVKSCKISPTTASLIFFAFHLIGYFKHLKIRLVFCFCVDFFQFYVPIQSKVWNSSNAQVMAKHYISFRIIQICLLRWLRMIYGVWALYDVKHHL